MIRLAGMRNVSVAVAVSCLCCPWPASAATGSGQSAASTGTPAQAQQPKPAKPQKPPKPPKAPWPPDTRKWDIEFHGLFGFGSTSDGGSGELPKPGASFTTGGGTESRLVPSWYFGDGAKLFNDVLGALGRSEAIVPLDSVMTGHAVDQTLQNAFGVRVTRALTPIMALEIEANASQATYTVRDVTRDALENTNASFPIAFGGLVASGQGVTFTNASIGSTFGWSDGTGVDIVTTASLVLHPKHDARVRPYVVAGAGVATAFGEAQATLTGHYALRVPNGAVIDESDNVTIHFGRGMGLVGVAGLGVNFRVTRGSGVRIDARGLVLENHVGTQIDASPSAIASNPAQAIWSFTTPGIQFVSNPSTGLMSTLDTKAMSGVTTLHPSGFHTRFNITVGYFWRF